MTHKPRLLLINDDGIHAPGLRHLFEALEGTADVSIVAPAIEQSGVGVAITLRSPLHIEEVAWDSKKTPAWKINGTPADCVRLAVSLLLGGPPDLIVSGINQGSNAGRNVLYSGTIGGVIEGTLRGIPGIAFSCEDFDKPDFFAVQKHILPVVRHVLECPLPSGTLLSVNFPEIKGEIKGFKLARQGRGYWREAPEKRLHPQGMPYYWMGGKWIAYEEHPESDVALLGQGYATVVPIHVGELTDYGLLEERKHLFEKLNTTI